MSGWHSASCPVWDRDGYKTITNYIKQLSETDGNISSTIMLHTVGTISSKDKKFYNLAKRYNPEWFVDIDPLFIVEFFVQDYDSPVVHKIIQKALSLKPNKITERCSIMKLHINESGHIGLYPNEYKEDAKDDAYTIHKRHDIYTYSEIERFLEGHSNTYINMVIYYLDKLDDGQDIY